MGAKDRLRAAAVAGLLLTGFPSAFAQNWTPTTTPTTLWWCLTSSADGSRIVAVVRSQNYGEPAPVYTSTNFGVTWTTNQTALFLQSMAAASDGMKLVGAWYSGPIYISTNSGDTWAITSAPETNWTSVASSADGTRLVAAASNVGRDLNGGRIYTSTNAGSTWILKDSPDQRWTAIACSADGNKLLAAGSNFWVGGLVYVSTNFGDTWTETPAPRENWKTVASSASGDVLAIGVDAGPLYTSTNGGASWMQASLPGAHWTSITSSADGRRLVATSWETGPCFSFDFGATWVSNSPPVGQMLTIASSADGCRLVAKHQLILDPSVLYIWQTTPSPELNITPSGGALLISWIVPSMPFVLQVTADLNTPNWTTVPMTPILNLTNLHHDVTVRLSGTNRFYRLQHL